GEPSGMSALWTIDAMAAAMRADRAGRLPAEVSGLSIDSRSIKPGEAYFAIKGDVHDGHAFVAPALSAGGGVAVVARGKRDRPPAGAPLPILPGGLDWFRGLCPPAPAPPARETPPGTR